MTYNRSPKLFSLREAAEYLRICDKTVRRLIKSGALRASLVGAQYRLSESDLAAYLASTKS